MINAIIVEDEHHSVEALKSILLEYCPQVKVYGVFDSVHTTALELIRQSPDLIFLDIKLTDGYSLELLDKINHERTSIIFITAYDEFAIKAIKFSALDYLLKPINIKELIQAVDKAQKHVKLHDDFTRVNFLMNNISNNGKFTQIALPTNTGFNFIEIKNIIRLEADGSYTNVYYLPKEKVLVTRPLKEYEQLLQHENFFRTHHSHLVNLLHIKKYVKGTGGYLVMSDGSSVDVAARRKEDLLKVLHIH